MKLKITGQNREKTRKANKNNEDFEKLNKVG
jgi:hypothetical protein